MVEKVGIPGHLLALLASHRSSGFIPGERGCRSTRGNAARPSSFSRHSRILEPLQEDDCQEETKSKGTKLDGRDSDDQGINLQSSCYGRL
jgi:hypothetical protein